MSSHLYAFAAGTFAPMLGNLSALLDKAEAHARAQGTDPDALVEARLAPDMFPLATQVAIACGLAVGGMTLLAGGTPTPPGENTDKTLDDLRARIAAAIVTLKAFPEAAFDSAGEREIVMPLFGTTVLEMKGDQFLREWTVPHFYFHVVTAYDILRNAGVELGKQDYIAHIAGSIHDRGPAAA